MKNKKKNRYLFLFLLLLGISVGYAFLSTTLKINGTTNITKQSWNVYWDNVEVSSGSISQNLPIITQNQGDQVNTKISWNVTLTKPKDFYEFTVDAVNAGSIDAMITNIDNSISPELPSYIKYYVTYADGIVPEEKHLLAKKIGNTPSREKYKIRVEFSDDITREEFDSIPSTALSFTFDYNVTYSQASNEAINMKTWILPEGKEVSTLQVGDELCYRGQCFNFIKYDGDNIVMLAKYNLKVGKNFTNSGIETSEYKINDPLYGLQSPDSRGYIDGASNYNGQVQFSQLNYWQNTGLSYPSYIYDSINKKGIPGTNNYSIAYYVELYKNNLENIGVDVESARLLNYNEVIDNSIGCSYGTDNCPTEGNLSFITNTSFWIGSAFSDYTVCVINSNGYFVSTGWNSYGGWGVRPVIEVNKNNI